MFELSGNKAPFQILQDGYVLKTPQGRDMNLPTQPLARRVMEEFEVTANKQEKGDDLFFTKLCYTALDQVAPDMANARNHILKYAGHDLLLYPASPEQAPRMAGEQERLWTPIINYATRSLGTAPKIQTSLSYTPQPETYMEALAGKLYTLSPWSLTALLVGTEAARSLLVGIAVIDDVLTPKELAQAVFAEENLHDVLSDPEHRYGPDPDNLAAQAQLEKLLDQARTFYSLSSD